MPDNASPGPVAAPVTVRFRALGALDLQRPGTGEVRALLVQPKRLALFAYLLLARPARLHRRDSLLALFWPESTGEQARRSLRQALHFLRQSLGGDVLTTRGDEEIGVVPGAAWCDVLEFDRALDEQRAAEALALYRGPLLDGFHVSGVAPELEHWIEAERARVHARAVDAATQLADHAEAEGNTPLAVQCLRELLRLAPGAEDPVRRLMTLLDRAGDRAGALRAYDDFARRLAADVGAEPARATTAVAERIRAGRSTGSTAMVVPGQGRVGVGVGVAVTDVGALVPPTSVLVPTRAISAPLAASRARLRRVVAALAAGVALLGLVVAAAWWRGRAGRTEAHGTLVLAVGLVGDRDSADSTTSGMVLRGLLATDLARVPGVTVISTARMQELLLRAGGGDGGRGAVMRTARAAGAEEVLEGEVYRRSATQLRLDVRRVEVERGVIRRAYTVEGPDLFALVERFSRTLAGELGQPAPTAALADVTTTSLAARRLYDEGVRAYYEGDARHALRLLRAALDEDSTFAMAAFFAARAASVRDGPLMLPFLTQAVRMSRRATARERLLIATEWAAFTNNAGGLALADSLARRFPLEPDGEAALGRALAWAGDYRQAIDHFRAAIARDTVGFGATVAAGREPAPCTVCGAFAQLGFIFSALDSATEAERALREWSRLMPQSEQPWYVLATTLAQHDRLDEARAAWRTATSLHMGEDVPDDVPFHVVLALRAGAFAEADRLLAERVREGTPVARHDAEWWQVISFRMQGRLDPAIRAALRYRAEFTDATSRLPQAQVLFESGRAREAAVVFEAASRDATLPVPPGAPDSMPGLRARAIAWPLAHAATAWAAAGDTARLALLADSVERLGAREAYARDRRLHHYLRGLLWIARGRPDEAIAAFRRAMTSPTMGYTRINLELGRLLVASGRATEAVAVLAPALRGELESNNYYATRTELHEALALAFDAAGRADSARVHWRWVADAWHAADPPFRARAARAARAASP